MSQDSRPTRRRLPLVIAAVAVLVLLGAGCAHDNTPQSYETTTPGNPVPVDEYNFIEGCTGGSTGTTIAPRNLCQCMIDWVMLNVPASDTDQKDRTNPDGTKTFADYTGPTFIAINKDLANHPDNLPDFVKTGLAQACASQGFVSSPGSSSGTAPLAPSTTQG